MAMKVTAMWAAGLVLVIGAAFALEVFALNWTGHFKPKWQNVERQTFEQTQSYVHGKTGDLAKYYEEYQTSEDKGAIAALVKMNFADFDEATIRNAKLREFLVEVRGY